MSDSKTPTRLTKVLHRAAHPETGAVKPAATARKNAERIHGRHAAITDNFNSWRSYKEWAEKIRGTWEEKN
jgi:LPS sulfotransferase NodH